MPFAAVVASPALWTSDWWSVVLRSPGFGGSLAVIAITIATSAFMLRARVKRSIYRDRRAADVVAAQLLNDTRAASSDAGHWWQMYQWVFSKLETLDSDQATSLLEDLETRASGPVEHALIEIALDRLAATRAGSDGS
ncbi:hypothetical protein [Sanguibacter sp. 25GB23B1]|uniref:hypothetical protein n=1 Tax=unclassified Sanguibacter TaxID=2645534 RepID=UPI0032AECF15